MAVGIQQRDPVPVEPAAAVTPARYVSTAQYLRGLRRALDGIERSAAPVRG